MVAFDVNVYVNAFRQDAPGHEVFRRALESVTAGSSPFGVSSVALSGFVRIVTHPKIFRDPTPLAETFAFYRAVVGHPLARMVEPAERHPEIFQRLCQETRATGNLVTDAWFAALAVEHGLTWLSGDRDYGLFSGLDWRWIKA